MKKMTVIISALLVALPVMHSPLSAQTELGAELEQGSEIEPMDVNDLEGSGQVLNPDPDLSEDDINMYRAIESSGLTKYIVQPGDTLWDICERILGSPWYWQKIWAMNPQIANPHWIEPGNIIYFQQAGMMGSMVTMEMEGRAVSEDDLNVIPEVLDPSEWGVVSEGGSYKLEQYLTKVTSSAFNFYNFRRDGFLAKSDMKYTGKIANAPTGKELLAESDLIYLMADREKTFSIGQSYQIFKQLGEIEHPVTGDDIGVKIRVLGKCIIKRINKNVVTAQITESFGPIERGDKVRPWKNPVKDIRPRRNKATVQGYIVDSLNDNLLLAESQVVFLDKGISQGVEEGNRMFVVRQLEPSGYDDGFDKEDLPYEKIGELIVLSAGSGTSVGLVTRSLLNLEIGDKFLMEKNY